MASTYTTHSADFGSSATVASRGSNARANTLGIFAAFRAIGDRLTRARQRSIDKDVGAFLEAHGGQLTDDLERQISRRFGTHAGNQW